MSKYKYIDVRDEDGITVITFTDEKILNDQLIEMTGAELFRVIAQDNIKLVVLDWSEVRFVASAILGKLLTLNKTLKAKQGRLAMCQMHPEIRELFIVTSMDKIFTVKNKFHDALACVSDPNVQSRDEKMKVVDIRALAVVTFGIECLTELSITLEIKRRLLETIHEQNIKRIILDFTGVKEIDSNFMEMLFGVSREIHELSGKMALCLLQQPLYDKLCSYGCKHGSLTFKMYSTRSSALEFVGTI